MISFIDKLLLQYKELEACKDDILAAYSILVSAYKNNGKVLLAGNGGSAADCEHINGELMKGFMKKRPVGEETRCNIINAVKVSGYRDEYAEYISSNLQGTLPSISLVSHSALVSAFSNDVAADMIFAQQIFGYGEKNDVFIGLSTSGNSKNIIYGAITAKAKGMKVIAMTGRSGGELKNIADVTIKVPSDITPRIQEYHLPVYHMLCEALEEEFFNE